MAEQNPLAAQLPSRHPRQAAKPRGLGSRPGHRPVTEVAPTFRKSGLWPVSGPASSNGISECYTAWTPDLGSLAASSGDTFWTGERKGRSCPRPRERQRPRAGLAPDLIRGPCRAQHPRFGRRRAMLPPLGEGWEGVVGDASQRLAFRPAASLQPVLKINRTGAATPPQKRERNPI